MKRRRDAEEILISSSDSDGSHSVYINDSSDDDDDESADDASADDDDADDADDDDDEDADIEDDETDDDDDDDEEEDYDHEEDTGEEDDDSDVSDDDTSRRAVSKQVPNRSKARKKASSGFFADGDVGLRKAGKKKHQQRLKKGGGHANSETVLSREDQKLFSEALNIIRGGGLEELKLEHCKAYLRHYSLRQTGSKKTILDRVQEHIELKACGGMAKYPRSTFTINCTGDACIGDVVLFQQRVKNYKKANRSCNQPSFLRRIVAGRIVKESYGSEKQQHTFTVEVLWSKGPKALPLLYPLLIKGRNLYRLRTFRQRWANEEERKRVLQEKHSRGAVARNAREDRISGKRPSCSNQMRLTKRKAEVTLKEQTKIKFSRVNNTNLREPSSSRGKAGGNMYTSKETAFRDRSMDSSVISSHRQSGRMFCGTSGSTKCVLSIKAGFAGLVIGAQGRNIGAISRASGARVKICEYPLNPTLRLVEVSGVPEEVQVAASMIIQSFLDRGLPPPEVTTLSSGFTGQGWQAQNFFHGLPVPNHNTFMPPR